MTKSPPQSPRVGLFATCLVDAMRPSVGFAAVRLLEQAGCHVEAPASQTCCGQPAFNSGDRADARSLATAVIEAFEPFDYLVAPSGSCAAMIKVHYPELFAADPAMHARAVALADKTFELVQFLHDVIGLDAAPARLDARITYHDSCSGLRELGIKDQPRALLASLEGVELTEMREPETCCGFGGLFCVKYPDISNDMVTKKTADIAATGADMVVAGDLGCLMNMAGKLTREGNPIACRHVAEVLAGFDAVPPIGQGRK